MGKSSKARLGNGKSNLVPFENIDYTRFAEQDKSNSFMTDESSLPIWICCLDEFYKKYPNEDERTKDITWTQAKSQHKISAQIKECEYNKNGASHSMITLSFYGSTNRILMQGTNCKLWCQNIFPQVKAMVEVRRENHQEISLNDIVEQLLKPKQQEPHEVKHRDNEAEPKTFIQHDSSDDSSSSSDESVIENSPGKKGTLQQRNETSLDTTIEVKTVVNEIEVTTEPSKEYTENLKTPQRPKLSTKSTPKRILPTPPANKDINRSLQIAISKLEGENIYLKEKLHDLSVENKTISKELNEQTQLLGRLQDEISELKVQRNTDITGFQSLILELNLLKSDTNKTLENIREETRRELTKETENIFSRLRILEQIMNESKENRTTIKENEVFSSRKFKTINENLEELKKEMNNIQEDLFNGEQVSANMKKAEEITNKDTLSQTRVIPHTAATPAQTKQQPEILFKDMKGQILLFGDSNTKGLDPRRIQMRIGSLSGAKIESAINHLHSKQEDRIAKLVIYHLGTNNVKEDNTDILKEKINTLIDLATKKYPSAQIGICQIPQRNDVANEKIEYMNKYIQEHNKGKFINNNVSQHHFTNDGKHYNKIGLAILAVSIKTWAKDQGYQFPKSTYTQNSPATQDHRSQDYRNNQHRNTERDNYKYRNNQHSNNYYEHDNLNVSQYYRNRPHRDATQNYPSFPYRAQDNSYERNTYPFRMRLNTTQYENQNIYNR